MNPLVRFLTERKVKSAEDRVMTFTASTDKRDSYGTVLNPDGWDLKRFNSNPVIGYQHNLYNSNNPDSVVGKGYAYIEDHKLMVDVTFEPAELNSDADKIWKKLEFGTLNAVSVGFLPVGKGKWGEGEEALTGKNPTYYYAGQELLEISIVNIPANDEALKNAMKPETDRLEQIREADLKEAETLAKEAEAARAEQDKTVLIAEAALQL